MTNPRVGVSAWAQINLRVREYFLAQNVHLATQLPARWTCPDAYPILTA